MGLAETGSPFSNTEIQMTSGHFKGYLTQFNWPAIRSPNLSTSRHHQKQTDDLSSVLIHSSQIKLRLVSFKYLSILGF